MAKLPARVADMTPQQLQSQLQMAIFVGVIGANVVGGALLLFISHLLK